MPTLPSKLVAGPSFADTFVLHGGTCRSFVEPFFFEEFSLLLPSAASRDNHASSRPQIRPDLH
jgi:hypothetical protein